MEQPGQHEVYRTKLDKVGRIRLPADLREQVHLQAGEELIIIRDGDQLQLKTFAQVIKEAQDYFATIAPPDRILSEELIAERRAEFAREQAESERD